MLPDDGGQLALEGEEGHGVEHVDFIDGIVQVVDGKMDLVETIFQMAEGDFAVGLLETTYHTQAGGVDTVREGFVKGLDDGSLSLVRELADVFHHGEAAGIAESAWAKEVWCGISVLGIFVFGLLFIVLSKDLIKVYLGEGALQLVDEVVLGIAALSNLCQVLQAFHHVGLQGV